MPEYNGRKNILIGAMTIAMIVISILAVYLINHKVSLVPGTVSQTQNIPPVPPTEVRRILGTVETVSGQGITLKDFRKISSIVSPVSDRSERMIVTIDSATTIEGIVYKDRATIADELDAFYKNIRETQQQSTSTPPRPPEPFMFRKITLSDIKVGEIITVYSAKDISTLTTFTATRVERRN